MEDIFSYNTLTDLSGNFAKFSLFQACQGYVHIQQMALHMGMQRRKALGTISEVAYGVCSGENAFLWGAWVQIKHCSTLLNTVNYC